jgi:hypothetical protein
MRAHSALRDGHAASLLDLDPRLGADLEGDREAARRATIVPISTLRPGPWNPTDLKPKGRTMFGLLVVEGLVLHDLILADTPTTELLGPGDLAPDLVSADALLPLEVRWSVARLSRVAVLDARLIPILAEWPTVAAQLLLRASRQAGRLSAQRAISQLPRIDQRLLALFWHLAERWGRVGRAGVLVPISLTHETLGRLVGARRPTVSLALKELAEDGTLIRREDGTWVLRHGSAQRLAGEATADWRAPEARLVALADPAGGPGGAGGGHQPRRREPTRDITAVDVETMKRRVQRLRAGLDDRRSAVQATLERAAATRRQVDVTRASIRSGRRPPP